MTEQPLLAERYRVEDEIGSGGMAVVYRARDELLERTVAIKLLRRDFSKDEDFRERFKQEAKAAANLTHPNIVTIYDFGLDARHLFIVMEYLPGENLKTIVGKRGPLPVNEALPLIVQACAGVGYAHRAGLVHCDIKSHNLLVSPDKRVKITDFGIARALASIQPGEQIDYVWGSPQYFSPEQAIGRAPSPASDVYSLGVVMYEVLTGRLPFEEDTLEELTKLHRDQLPRAPRELNSEIPAALERIILKVLSKEPSARYRTADQLGRVLITFSKTQAGTTPTPVVPAPEPQLEAEPAPNHPPDPPRLLSPDQARPPNLLEVDWVAVLLGVLALIAVGGLIPFWIWVYFQLQ